MIHENDRTQSPDNRNGERAHFNREALNLTSIGASETYRPAIHSLVTLCGAAGFAEPEAARRAELSDIIEGFLKAVEFLNRLVVRMWEVAEPDWEPRAVPGAAPAPPDPIAVLVAEIAPALMLDRAREFDAESVKDALYGREAVAALDEAARARLVEAIMQFAQTADITIDSDPA